MGAKEIDHLEYRNGYIFMGIKGTKSHLEKRGTSVNAGMILGYSRVVKTKKTTTTKTTNQTISYKRTITRVYKKKVTETKNGVKTTKIVTRVKKRVVTCKKTRKLVKKSHTTKTTVN